MLVFHGVDLDLVDLVLSPVLDLAHWKRSLSKSWCEDFDPENVNLLLKTQKHLDSNRVDFYSQPPASLVLARVGERDFVQDTHVGWDTHVPPRIADSVLD